MAAKRDVLYPEGTAFEGFLPLAPDARGVTKVTSKAMWALWHQFYQNENAKADFTRTIFEKKMSPLVRNRRNAHKQYPP